MKKLLAICILVCVFAVSACGKKPAEEKKEPAEEIKVEEKVEESEFYTAITKSDTRPIAVMIDNDSNAARPQIGLEDAFLVYEIIVEGGASRFMALFKDCYSEKIGPIRSSRHYFLDYAMENDAIYAHCGWSPRAANDISAWGVNNINGIKGSDGVNFWRDNTYDNTWHNLYTSLKKLSDFADSNKKYRMKSQELVLSYNSLEENTGGTAVTDVNLPYSSFYRVGYTYNNEKKVFERSVNGNPHVSQTGEVLTAKNIIIYQLENYDINDGEAKGRQDVITVGSGTGWYLTNGEMIEIKWSKADRKSKTVYTKADGSELIVNPGNTYIQIVPKRSTVTFE